MNVRRLLAIVAIVLAVPVLLVGGAVAMAESEWGERWLEKRIAGRTGRTVDVEGIDIGLRWPLEVRMQRLHIGNPAWATTPALVDADRLDARVEVLPLLQRRLVIPYLGADRASAGLERDGERATWRFGEGESGESPLVLGRVSIGDGTIAYRDRGENTSIDAAVRGSAGAGGELAVAAKGTFRGEAVDVDARVPALDPSPAVPIRIVAQGSVGRTKIGVDGTIAQSLETLDVALRLDGQSMKDLRKLFGTSLPDTPRYSIAGRLRRDSGQWRFEPFDGKVGDSDLHGDAAYRTGGERRRFEAKLNSKLLDLADLGPVVGAPAKPGGQRRASTKQTRKVSDPPAAAHVLPRDPLPTARWSEMDADVTLAAKRVLRPDAVPIDNLSTRIVMDDALLRLAPLSFGLAGGRLSGPVTLNGRDKPVSGNVDMEMQGVQLARLFPITNTETRSIGTLYGRIKLAGRGQSLGELLGSSNGNVTFAIDGGSVSLLLVELLGLDVAEALQLLGTRNRQVTLRCAIGDLVVKDGIATPQAFVIDTTDTVVNVTGSIDLEHETIDLVFRPEPKDPSIFALRSPIHLQGPLRSPKVRPEAGPIVARVAAAALLGALNPVLALLPFIETGPGKDSDCGRLIAGARSHGAQKKPG
jgi:uncharacterized protein involved in outer membrane biogenesis